MAEGQKHIAFYIHSLAKGGSEHVFINLALYLFERGYRITFVTTYLAKTEYEVPHASWRIITKEEAATLGEKALEVSHHDDTPAYITYDRTTDSPQIDRVFSGLKPGAQKRLRAVNFSRRTSLLRNTWDDLRPDLIISTIGKNNVMALLSSMGMRIPVIVRVAGNPSTEYSSRQVYLSMAATFPRAAAVALQMEGQMSFFPPKVREKAVIMHNSLDPAFLREPYGGEREKVVVSVGHLDHNKNHQMLIKAFARVQPKYPEWKLVIYGEGSERRHLQQLITTLGMREHVELPGHADHIEEKIYKAGVFVLCSNEEGMPNALLEAMALGIPCISTDCPCGGPKEVIKDGFNGLLTPVGDVARMETALIRFLGNRGLMKTCGQKALDIRKIYAPDAVNAAWEELIVKAMEPEAELPMTGTD